MRKDILLGIIIYTILIGTGIVYYTFPDEGLKIRIDEDKTTFYIKQGFYRVVAREIGSMWDFPSKMNRDLSQLTRESIYDIATNTSQEIRTTVYIRGPIVKDTYYFDGRIEDIAQHPKDHIIEIYNAKGYVYQYEVRNLWYYKGETISGVTSPVITGRIKIEWQDGYYFSKLYKSKILKVRYKINTDYVQLKAKVVDPASTTYLYFIDSSDVAHTAPIDVEDESTITVKGNVTPSNLEVCISADHPDIGTNISCGTGSAEYNWTVISGSNEFSDSTTEKNITWAGAGNGSVNLKSIRNESEVIRSKFTVTGYASSGNYPKNLLFDLNNDSTTDASIWGELQGQQIKTSEFNGSVESETLSYNTSGVRDFIIKLPKDFNVTSATWNITGAQNNYPRAEYQTLAKDSDGAIYDPYSPSVAERDGTNDLYSFGGKCIDDGFNVCSGIYNTTVKIDIGEGVGAVTLKKDIPYNMGVAGCVVFYNTYFYVIGGWDESTHRSETYRYKPVPEGWTSRTSMPYPKSYAQCVVKDDLVYIGGGYSTGSVWNKSLLRYNITANTWTELANLPDGKEQGWAEVLNDTHLIFFGGTRRGSTGTGGKTYEYNIAADTWAERTASPSIYANSGANIDGTIYLYGGLLSAALSQKIYRYNTTSGTWTEMSSVLEGYMYENDCDEVGTHAVCLGTGGLGYGQYEEIIYHYPNDVGIQIGDSENLSYTNTDDVTIISLNIGNATSEINTALQTCTEDSDGYCYIKVWVQNIGSGDLNMENLSIVTDISAIDTGQANITCGTTYCDQTMRVYSDQQGILEISNINNTWHGTHNVTWNISTPGNATYDSASTTGITTVYYSKFLRTLPYTWTERIFFAPSNYDIAEVEAYGQSTSTPLINITSQAQDKTFNFSIRLNESTSCLNITVSSNNNVSQRTNLTESYQFFNQTTAGGSQGYWMWADLDNCNASVKRYLTPSIDWKACCDTCVGC